MSLFTIVFPEQVSGAASNGSVENVAVMMLGLGVVGIVLTLLASWKAQRTRTKPTGDELARISG